jgi:hypothetical protein
MHELNNIARLWGGGNHVLDTPADGGTFVQRGAYHMARVTTGTYVLPDNGAPQYVYAVTGPVTVQSVLGATVATISAGQLAYCIPVSPTEWTAVWLNEGAIPTGLDDITTAAALQDRLDNDRENAILNRLKTGEVLVTSTRDIDGGYGGAVEGYASVLADADPDDDLQRQFSALTRSGDFAGEPMLRLKRAYTTLSNFSLFGDTMEAINSGTYTDGELALLMTRDASAGTGKTNFDRLVFDAWDVAVQISLAAEEFNCDESLWYFPSFWRCDTAFRQLSRQSLGHHFVHPHFHLVDNPFDLLGGGDIHVLGGLWARHRNTATDCAFIRYRNDTIAEFGLNAGGVLVEGLKIDSQCRGVMLLDMEPASGQYDYLTTVRFNHLQVPWDAGWSNDWTGPMFNISGAMHLIIDGATVLYPDAIKWNVTAGAICRVTVMNCSQCLGTTWEDFFDTAGSTGTIVVNFVNNGDGNQSLLPDYRSADVANVTTVADPGVAIPIAAKHVTVTSDNADKIVVLPPPVIGKVVTGYVGANGCEFYADSGVATTINGVTCSATNEAAMPANSLWRAECVAAGAWILTYITSAGAAGATITPNSR